MTKAAATSQLDELGRKDDYEVREGRNMATSWTAFEIQFELVGSVDSKEEAPSDGCVHHDRCSLTAQGNFQRLVVRVHNISSLVVTSTPITIS